MGVVVQFRLRGSSPELDSPSSPTCQPSTLAQRGDGPSLDPGAFGVFLDRARRKRNACLQLRGMGSGDESSGRTAVRNRGQMGEERVGSIPVTPMLKKPRVGSTPTAPTKWHSSQLLTPIRPGAASRTRVPAQPTETP